MTKAAKPTRRQKARRPSSEVDVKGAASISVAGSDVVGYSYIGLLTDAESTAKRLERERREIAERQELEQHRRRKKPGRKGWFANDHDFLQAWRDTLSELHGERPDKPPHRYEVICRLVKHPLFQDKIVKEQLRDRPTREAKPLRKTFYRWLKRCGLTFDDEMRRAWRGHHQETRTSPPFPL